MMTLQSSRSAQSFSVSESSPVAGFPQVGLQQALEAAFALYAAEQGTRWIDEGRFSNLLGHDRQSGQLVRLTAGMKLYGLITSRKHACALTEDALKLFTSADQDEFMALVYDAALLPQGVRELANTYSASLDSRELEQELKDRRIAEQDRALILKVLRENGELVHREQQLGELFGRFQAALVGQANPRAAGWFRGFARWMNTQPGRTANLAAVAVMFVGSLAYVASDFLPLDRVIFRSAREVTAPVAAVRVPFTAVAPAAASRDMGSRDIGSQSQAGTTNRQLPVAQVPAAPLPVTQTTASRQITSQTADGPPAQPAPREVIRPRDSASNLGAFSPAPGQATGSTTLRPAIIISEPVVTGWSAALDQPVLTLARGREFAQMLFTQRLNGLWSSFSPSVQREWGGYSVFAAYRASGLKAFGAETEVVSEDVRRSGGVSYYTRTATFERGPRHDWTLIIGIDPAGSIVAFNIVDADVLPNLTALGSH